MNIEIITKQDLENFKNDLLQELSKVISSNNTELEKTWLRSKEVKKLLGISSSSLVNLRIKGLLNPSKVSGVYYYKLSEVQALLENGTQE